MRLTVSEAALQATHPCFVQAQAGEMIAIAPKALRFARLAAEQQPAFADDSQIAMMRRQEDLFLRSSSIRRVDSYVGIPQATADFCVRVVAAFLEQPDRFQSSEWDGNDFAFLQAVAQSLRDQLARLDA